MKRMEREKSIIITGIFVYMLISFLSINSLFAEAETKKDNLKTAEDSKAQSKLSGVITREVEDYKGEGLRDPFKDYFDTIPPPSQEDPGNLNAPPQPLPPLEVQGVILGARLRQAIVNNKIVKVGDTIEGVRITTIEKDGITVFFGNRSYNLSSPAAGTLQDLKKKPEGGSDEK